MLRVTGMIFVLIGGLALWADLMGRVAGATAFSFASIGQRWFEVHRPSLIGLQSGLENRVSPDAFFSYVQPALELPAVPVFIVLGLLLLSFGRLIGRGRRR